MNNTNHFQFKSDPLLVTSTADNIRKFSGVAYSGEIINHRHWGRVVFDLSTTTANNKTPMLIEHDRDKRVGFTESVTIDSKITISGVFLSNDDAKEMIQDADEGFPWQQSIHIEPEIIREIPNSKTEKINGHDVSGVTVFENSTIREISFTPTGVDANTPTKIFSLQNGVNKMAGQNNNGIDALKTQIEDLKTQLIEANSRADVAEAAMADTKKKQRKFSVESLEKSAGKEFSDSDKETLFSLDEAAFNLFSAQVTESPQTPAQKLPDSLFSVGSQPDAQANQNPANLMMAATKRISGVS